MRCPQISVSNAILAEWLFYGTSNGFALVHSRDFSCHWVRIFVKAFPKIGVSLVRRYKFELVTSSLVPEETAYAINTLVASVILIRRDVTVEEWSDPLANRYGVKATSRFGLGITRSNAIAKMVNIKTTL